MSFLKNKNANYLAFDEAIGEDSDFDKGNTKLNAINESKEIITFLINEECFDDNIKYCHLNELLEIINKTNDFNYKLNNEGYYLAGWVGHVIFLFYKKISNDNYDLGIINAGEGSELQGVDNDLCNGIIIFHNITEQKLDNFLILYNMYNIILELYH